MRRSTAVGWPGSPPSTGLLACANLVISDTAGMLVDINALRRHRAAIRMGDDGYFVWGDFERVVAESMEVRETGQLQRELYRQLRATQNRLTDLRTIPVKLNWMLQQRDAGTLDPYDWMFFASSDVNSFLANVRSLFDHLADALRAAAPKPGGIPQQSFRKLRDWVAKDGERAAEQLGRSACRIVAGCDWFQQLRAVRDDLTHRDAQTIILPGVEGIAVVMFNRTRQLLDEPELMGPGSFLRFERLAAATMGRVYELLEETAAAIATTAGFRLAGDGASVHSGLGVLAQWTDDYLVQLE